MANVAGNDWTVIQIFPKDWPPTIGLSYTDSVDFINILISQNNTALITLTPEGTNLRKEFVSSPGFIAVQALYSLWTLLIICFALKNLRGFYLANGKQFILSIGEVCLVIEIFSNFLRFIYVLIDPFWSRNTGLMVGEVFTSISTPFQISTTLLLACFWHELICTVDTTVSPFLTTMKVPFYIISIIALIVELTCDIARGLFPAGQSIDIAKYLTVALYFFLEFPLIAFYFYQASKVMKFIKDLSLKNKKYKNTLRKLTFLVCASGGGGVIIEYLFGVTAAIRGLYNTLFLYYLRFWILFFMWNVISIVHILAFDPKNRRNNDTTPVKSDRKVTEGAPDSVTE